MEMSKILILEACISCMPWNLDLQFFMLGPSFPCFLPWLWLPYMYNPLEHEFSKLFNFLLLSNTYVNVVPSKVNISFLIMRIITNLFKQQWHWTKIDHKSVLTFDFNIYPLQAQDGVIKVIDVLTQIKSFFHVQPIQLVIHIQFWDFYIYHLATCFIILPVMWYSSHNIWCHLSNTTRSSQRLSLYVQSIQIILQSSHIFNFFI